MKVTKIMYSGIAVKQLAFSFNEKHGTNISVDIDMREGNSFVTIGFGEISEEMIFEFSFELGKTQKLLMTTKEFMLPLGKYPLPPETDE